MASTENNGDTQLEFELPVDDQPSGTATEAVFESPETTDEQVAPPVDELGELRKQLEEANRLRADAEARANTLSSEKSASETRLATEVNARFSVQEQAIDAKAISAKSRLDNAKREIARAHAEQRYEDVAELQGEIAAATLDARQAEWDKSQIGALKERAKLELEAQSSRAADPEAQFLSSIPGEKSRQWLRAHPDILRKVSASPSEAKRLYAYANLAEAEGHAPDSDGYLEAIGEKFAPKETPAVVTTPAAPAKAAPKAPGNTAAAAPSNRSATPGNGNRRVTLDDVVKKLTPNDRASAKISFPDKSAEEAEKLYAHGLVISKQRDSTFRPDIRL